MRKQEPAISRVLSWTTIHLGRPSPIASSNLPGSPLRRAVRAEAHYSPIWSCSRRGLPCRGVLPPARCALTAPFHPYRRISAGGIFSVALSMGSRPPGVTWRPARWSPDFPPRFEKSITAVVWPTLTFSKGIISCRLSVPVYRCRCSLIHRHRLPPAPIQILNK